MSSVGYATLQIIPSLKGVSASVERQLGPTQSTAAKAGDEAGKKFSGRFASGAKKVAKAGMLAVGVGLAAMFKVGLDEQSDFLAGQAQLANGIKTTGNAANVTVGGLEDLASQIQNYSGQTDDSIVASEKLLLTFTSIRNAAGKNNDIFTQATKLTADMAAKMGGDASSNAVLLGKALNDPAKGLTALTRVGVSFSAGQVKQIKALSASGKTMQAQKIILAELSKEFGGSAKAAGDTLPGQLTRAKRAFEDASQSVVAAMMPALTALANILTKYIVPLFTWVVNFITAHKTIFAILATAIGAIVVVTKAWAIGQGLLNAVMEANPILLVVTAIAALAAGLVVAYQKSETFRNIVQGAFDVVKTAVGSVVSVFTKTLPNAFKAVYNGLKSAWDKVTGFLRKWGPVALAILVPFLGIPLLIKQHFGQIIGWLKGVWSSVKGGVSSFVSSVAGAIMGIPGKIAGLGGKMLTAGGKLLGGFIDGIKDVAGKAAGFIGDIFGNVASAIKNTLNDLLHLPWKLPKIKIGAFGHYVHVGGQTVLPKLARGGMTTGPTQALIGDNPSGNEVVMPMDSSRTVATLARALSQAAALAGTGGGSGVYVADGAIRISEASDPVRTATTTVRRITALGKV